MDSKPHTNKPKDELWTSGQMLDVIFDTHWKEFVEFAEKCLKADISFIEESLLRISIKLSAYSILMPLFLIMFPL